MANPTFGEKKENVTYQPRYSVYAVIPDAEKKQIVLVQAPNGAWFLPGGEIEAGEDHRREYWRFSSVRVYHRILQTLYLSVGGYPKT